ncbi:MAG: hypothetical protein KF863_00585 [Rubrivivax sp.]|nr:hypothetical protein [Rubrivivax sp.]
MNEADRSPRWFHLGRDEPAPAADDPADLGTAFGLDLSLQRAQEAGAEPAAVAGTGWLPHLKLVRRAG